MFGRIKVQTWLILGILHEYVAIPLLLFSWRGCSSHFFATVLWIFVFQFFYSHCWYSSVVSKSSLLCCFSLLHYYILCAMFNDIFFFGGCFNGWRILFKDDVWSSAIVTCRTVSAWLWAMAKIALNWMHNFFFWSNSQLGHSNMYYCSVAGINNW